MSVPAVFAAISAVQKALAAKGIGKDRRNTTQNFQFRGIDDVYNAVAPIMPAHGLVVIPEVQELTSEARATKSGGELEHVRVRMAFKFIAVADGSAIEAVTYGQAMDSADKATNKAMSAAMKYAFLMTFTIPTEGDNDADASTPEPAQRNTARNGSSKPVQTSKPATEAAELKHGRFLSADETKNYVRDCGFTKEQFESEIKTRDGWTSLLSECYNVGCISRNEVLAYLNDGELPRRVREDETSNEGRKSA